MGFRPSRLVLVVLFAFIAFFVGINKPVEAAQRSARRPSLERLSREETLFVRAQLKLAKPHGRGPRYDSLVIRYLGGNAKELKIQAFRVNRNGVISKNPDESVTLNLAGNGSFRWELPQYGRAYLVRAVDLASGNTVLQQTYVPIRGSEGSAFTIADDGTPPIDQQIANLRAQLALVQAQLDSGTSQNAALQAQIVVLQQRIADLQAAAGQTDVNFEVTASVLGAVNNRARSAVDDDFVVTVSSTAKYDSRADAFEFELEGPALVNVGWFTLALIDNSTNSGWQINCYADASGKCTGILYPGYYFPVGAAKQFKGRLNSASFANQASTTDGLKVTLKEVTSYAGKASYGLKAPVTVFNGTYE